MTQSAVISSGCSSTAPKNGFSHCLLHGQMANGSKATTLFCLGIKSESEEPPRGKANCRAAFFPSKGRRTVGNEIFSRGKNLDLGQNEMNRQTSHLMFIDLLSIVPQHRMGTASEISPPWPKVLQKQKNQLVLT